VFSPTITLVELQAILDEAQLRIISGPTEAGVYSLRRRPPTPTDRRSRYCAGMRRCVSPRARSPYLNPALPDEATGRDPSHSRVDLRMQQHTGGASNRVLSPIRLMRPPSA